MNSRITGVEIIEHLMLVELMRTCGLAIFLLEVVLFFRPRQGVGFPLDASRGFATIMARGIPFSVPQRRGDPRSRTLASKRCG